MDFNHVKSVYTFSCVFLCFIFLLPTLVVTLPPPGEEKFSELWLLGSNHTIEGGSLNVSTATPHTVYLGVANHMNDLEYYKVYVKFRQQNELLPDEAAELGSPLEPIFEYCLFLSNNETWEGEFKFSFEEITFEENIAHVSKLSINGYEVNVDKTVIWDKEGMGFYCQFFYELWIYNSTTLGFQYHNRYVSLWLKLTNTS